MPKVTVIREPRRASSLKAIQELIALMSRTHTDGQAREFMRKIREATRALHLPPGKMSNEFAYGEWKKLVDTVRSTDKTVSMYDNAWPVRVYFDMRAKNFLAGKYQSRPPPVHASSEPPSRECFKGERKRIPGYEVTKFRKEDGTVVRRIQPTPKKPSCQRVFVGKPPPDMVISKGTRIRLLSPKPPAPASRPPLIVIDCDESDDELDVAPCSETPWDSETTQQTSRLQVVKVGCFDCGRPLPREYMGPSPELQALIQAADHLALLYDAGLGNDHHLASFVSWPVVYQDTFFALLPTTNFARFVIRRRFLQRVPPPCVQIPEPHLSTPCSPPRLLRVTPVPAPSKATRPRGEEVAEDTTRVVIENPEIGPRPTRLFSGVLEPSPELEEEITDPTKSLDLLYEAMCLNDNRALFYEVVNLIKAIGFPYISTYHPNREQFEETVKQILKERIVFERYENAWPIRLILKRIARETGSKPLDDHLHSSQSRPEKPVPPLPSAKARSGQAKEPTPCTAKKPASNGLVTPSIRYTCPDHPGVDVHNVALSIRRFLHSKGLSELIPIFASVGVRKEEDLKRFYEFADVEKDDVVNDCGVYSRSLELNAFQRIALKAEFTADRIEQFEAFIAT